MTLYNTIGFKGFTKVKAMINKFEGNPEGKILLHNFLSLQNTSQSVVINLEHSALALNLMSTVHTKSPDMSL